MKLDIFQEQILLCTARIVVPIPEKNEESVGTGFIVGASIADGRQLLLLISNKHVFVGSDRTALVSFHRCRSDNKSKPKLGDVIRAKLSLAGCGYTEHPDPQVDLACINISALQATQPDAYYKQLPVAEFAATFQEEWLIPGGQVCFVGYPAGLFDETNNLPILRTGSIASHPQIHFNGKPQFLIDAHVHGGSSGSPVFALTPPDVNEAAKFVGVVTQTIMKQDRVVTLAAAAQYATNNTIGIGIVLRAELVRELQDAAVLRYLATKQKIDAEKSIAS